MLGDVSKVDRSRIRMCDISFESNEHDIYDPFYSSQGSYGEGREGASYCGSLSNSETSSYYSIGGGSNSSSHSSSNDSCSSSSSEGGD